MTSCDDCGYPYWEHTHEERIKRDALPFRLDNAFDRVPITPEQAQACRRKWEGVR